MSHRRGKDARDHRPGICPQCKAYQLEGEEKCSQCGYSILTWLGLEVENHSNLLHKRNPLNYSKSKDKRGTNMNVEPDTSDWLKADFVEHNALTEITIKGDFEEVEDKFKEGKKKIQCEVTYDGMGKNDPHLWTMNSKSKNILIAILGGDTDKWVDIPIPITLQGEGDMRHFVPDEVRLKKIAQEKGLLVQA